MADLTRTQLTTAFELLRARIGMDRHAIVLYFSAGSDMRTFQYIATTERHETIQVLRDIADALEQRPPAPNVDLN